MNSVKDLKSLQYYQSIKSASVLRNDLVSISVKGKDRFDFLNRLSSQKIHSRSVGEIVPVAFLRANASVVALAHAWFLEDEIILLTTPAWHSSLKKFLDDFHFGEEIVISVGPACEAVERFEIKMQEGVIHKNFEFLPYSSDNPRVERLADNLVSMEVWECLMSLHSRPWAPESFPESNIIVEAELADYVHRNKGCYPGQEVVERLYTYGNVSKKTVPVLANKKLTTQVPLQMRDSDGETVQLGVVLGFVCQLSEGFLYFASLKRRPLEKSSQFVVIQNDEVVEVQVVL